MDRAGIGRSQALKEQERDISERVALGQAQPTLTQTVMDSSLMNQSGGLDSGFGEDDENMAYDKPMKSRKAMNIYGGLKDLQATLDDEEDNSELESVLKKRGPRDEKAGTRTRPVEFEKGDTDNLLGMAGFVSS